MSWAPFFHPSGRYFIFTSNKLGFSNFELYLCDSDGTHEPVRVTFTDGFDGLPVFSPDGERLCWSSNRTSDGKTQLFLGRWHHEAALAALNSAPRQIAGPPQVGETRLSSGPNPERPLSPEITAEDVRREVSYLASEKLQGRMTGSPGAQLASEYIA